MKDGGVRRRRAAPRAAAAAVRTGCSARIRDRLPPPARVEIGQAQTRRLREQVRVPRVAEDLALGAASRPVPALAVAEPLLHLRERDALRPRERRAPRGRRGARSSRSGTARTRSPARGSAPPSLRRGGGPAARKRATAPRPRAERAARRRRATRRGGPQREEVVRERSHERREREPESRAGRARPVAGRVPRERGNEEREGEGERRVRQDVQRPQERSRARTTRGPPPRLRPARRRGASRGAPRRARFRPTAARRGTAATHGRSPKTRHATATRSGYPGVRLISGSGTASGPGENDPVAQKREGRPQVRAGVDVHEGVLRPRPRDGGQEDELERESRGDDREGRPGRRRRSGGSNLRRQVARARRDERIAARAPRAGRRLERRNVEREERAVRARRPRPGVCRRAARPPVHDRAADDGHGARGPQHVEDLARRFSGRDDVLDDRDALAGLEREAAPKRERSVHALREDRAHARGRARPRGR